MHDARELDSENNKCNTQNGLLACDMISVVINTTQRVDDIKGASEQDIPFR